MNKLNKLLVPAISACALGGLALATPASAAEPQRLDDAQMDAVSAGLLNNFNIAIAVQTNINASPAIATAVGVFSGVVRADAGTITTQFNWLRGRQQ